MENLLWGLLDGIIAWPTLIVNVFGGDYQVFQDRRGAGWYAFGFLLGASSPLLGMFGRSGGKKERMQGQSSVADPRKVARAIEV